MELPGDRIKACKKEVLLRGRSSMKKVCKIVFIIASVFILLSVLFVLFMTSWKPSDVMPFGIVYKSSYEIPAKINDRKGLYWHPVGHWSPVTGPLDELYDMFDDEYVPDPPENIRIINIYGPYCTIMADFSSAGDDKSSYADNVPLSKLSYDPVMVGIAKFVPNDYQVDNYYPGHIVVDKGGGNITTFSGSYPKVEDLPDVCLAKVSLMESAILKLLPYVIFFALSNLIFWAVIKIRSGADKSVTIPCVILTIINLALILIPLIKIILSFFT